LFVVLVFPAIVMIFSYGRIIFEVCRVFKQRERMTNGTARASRTNASTNQARFNKSNKTAAIVKNKTAICKRNR
jgi:Flp pilus assembly protein TadG